MVRRKLKRKKELILIFCEMSIQESHRVDVSPETLWFWQEEIGSTNMTFGPKSTQTTAEKPTTRGSP